MIRKLEDWYRSSISKIVGILERGRKRWGGNINKIVEENYPKVKDMHLKIKSDQLSAQSQISFRGGQWEISGHWQHREELLNFQRRKNGIWLPTSLQKL